MRLKPLSLLVLLVFTVLGCNKTIESTSSDVVLHKVSMNKPIDSLKNDSIHKAFVLGKFDYKSHPDFIKVKAEHSTKTLYLDRRTYDAFIQMHEAATKQGIDLKIISGTRNFKEQKAIWERKWKSYKNLEPKARALKILEFSSMPSTSRHHWGTDLDLNSLNNLYFNSGKGKDEYQWLLNNANNFGFYQVYTDKANGRTGYNLEKWHWSFLPLANKYLNFYNANVSYEDIIGFKGDTLAKSINIITDYVNGLSKTTLNYN